MPIVLRGLLHQLVAYAHCTHAVCLITLTEHVAAERSDYVNGLCIITLFMVSNNNIAFDIAILTVTFNVN